MTPYTAGGISKIKFLVGYRFFSNGYKKNLPLRRQARGMGPPGETSACLSTYIDKIWAVGSI